jgi:hypothetical protein
MVPRDLMLAGSGDSGDSPLGVFGCSLGGSSGFPGLEVEWLGSMLEGVGGQSVCPSGRGEWRPEPAGGWSERLDVGFRGSLTSRLGRSEKLGQVGSFGNEASKSVVGNALKTRVRLAEALSSEEVEAKWRKRHERS